MPNPDAPPTLTIGETIALLRQEFATLSHSALHFLEREGLITTQRTAGGHRLYGEDDIQRIRQIKRWQGEGRSLDDIRHRLHRQAQLPQATDLAQAFLDHAIAGRRAEAQHLLFDASDLGVSPTVLFDDVLVPALVEVGDRWRAGTVLVAQEKEISEIAREAVIEIVLRHSPRRPDGPAVVAACIEGEFHELGLRMISGLLRIEGLQVHFLGANVAPVFLRDAVRIHRPEAVLLSARDAANRQALETTLDALRAPEPAAPDLRIIVGGLLSTSMPEAIHARGAIALPPGSVADAAADVRRLLA